MNKLVLPVMLSALLPCAANAQSATEPGDAAKVDEIVIAEPLPEYITVIANRVMQAPTENGLSTNYLTRADIESRQSTSLSDLLSTTTGVSATRNGGVGGFSAVRIRGAEGEQTLVMIDGVRVNDPSSPGGGFDFGTLLASSVDRVEILRGPNAVAWGSQAIGGVVDVRTRSIASGGAGSAEYGGNDAVAATAESGMEFGARAGITAGVGYFHDGGISAFKGGAENDGTRQFGAHGKAFATLFDALDVSMSAFYAKSRIEADGYPPPFYAFSDTPEFSRASEFYGNATASFRLFDDGLSNRFRFTLADNNRDNFDTPGQTTPSFLSRGRSERFEYEGKANLIGEDLRAVIGVEHEKSRISDGFSRLGTHVNSGFLQFVGSPWRALTFVAGARLDDHKAYGSKATLGANLAWQPAENTTLRASYGEGFKAPTLYQLYSFYGNRLLLPETARSYEVGINQGFWQSRLTLDLALFQRDTGNQIDFISCFGSSTGICTGRPFGTYDNVVRTRAKGLEASLAWNPASDWQISANYSYTDAKNRITNLALLRRPKHSFNMSVDWGDWQKPKIGISAQALGASDDVDFQTFARTRLSGYVLVHARGSIPVNDNLELYGRVENLFDKSYETVSGYSTYGRNAHVGVRLKF